VWIRGERLVVALRVVESGSPLPMRRYHIVLRRAVDIRAIRQRLHHVLVRVEEQALALRAFARSHCQIDAAVVGSGAQCSARRVLALGPKVE